MLFFLFLLLTIGSLFLTTYGIKLYVFNFNALEKNNSTILVHYNANTHAFYEWWACNLPLSTWRKLTASCCLIACGQIARAVCWFQVLRAGD